MLPFLYFVRILFTERTRLLHWSSIVGASHGEDYSIWEYGKPASRAVKEVCEYGYVNHMEQEMRRNVSFFNLIIMQNSIKFRQTFRH